MKFRIRLWTRSGDSYREMYYGGSKPRAYQTLSVIGETLVHLKTNALVILYSTSSADRTERMEEIHQIKDGCSFLCDAKPEPW